MWHGRPAREITQKIRVLLQTDPLRDKENGLTVRSASDRLADSFTSTDRGLNPNSSFQADSKPDGLPPLKVI